LRSVVSPDLFVATIDPRPRLHWMWQGRVYRFTPQRMTSAHLP
jgi:hypothetical protein